MRKYLLVLALAGCTAAPVVSTPPASNEEEKQNQAPASQPAVPVKLESSCPAPGAYQAVDLSQPVTQKFLYAMKQLKVSTIIRYGDYPQETIAGKTPKAAELALIQANGFRFLAVFQHNNSKQASFTAARGEADALRMLELYPSLPVWYFGVDLDAYSSADQGMVKTYAAAFKKVADAHGKLVGVYGSGLTLTNLKKAGLAALFWVSQSTGFSGTKEFTASKQWHMLQSMPKDCGGINVDFDQVNSAVAQ